MTSRKCSAPINFPAPVTNWRESWLSEWGESVLRIAWPDFGATSPPAFDFGATSVWFRGGTGFCESAVFARGWRENRGENGAEMFPVFHHSDTKDGIFYTDRTLYRESREFGSCAGFSPPRHEGHRAEQGAEQEETRERRSNFFPLFPLFAYVQDDFRYALIVIG